MRASRLECRAPCALAASPDLSVKSLSVSRAARGCECLLCSPLFAPPAPRALALELYSYFRQHFTTIQYIVSEAHQSTRLRGASAHCRASAASSLPPPKLRAVRASWATAASGGAVVLAPATRASRRRGAAASAVWSCRARRPARGNRGTRRVQAAAGRARHPPTPPSS